MIKTEAGEKMKKENPNKDLPEKADINNDGEFQEWEKARHEAIEAARAGDTPEMAMGGLMQEGMGVIIGIEAESGNEIPAGSMPEEVADDIPAMLSEGEYVVPADVVRWHGVKTFEELRCEAKMGMGLMAHDGRIAEVDEETKKPVDYDIEEKDKPKVEKQESEVVEAAEGALVTPQAPFYRYESRLNPATNRFEFVPVDPITGETVSAEEFNQAQSTRYTPQTVLGLDSAEATPECPEGFEYDEEVGACMPIDRPRPQSVVTPGDGGDGAPDVTGEQVQGLAGLGSYQLAEAIGPNAEFAGKPVDALTRATTPFEAPVTGFMANTLIGGLINEGSRMYDSVGAHRAVLQRTEDIQDTALGLDATALPQTYNLNFNPETASYTATTSSRITELQEREGGGTWATDYTHTDRQGNEIDPFSSEENFGSALDAIDADFEAMTAVTGGPQLDTSSGQEARDRGVSDSESQAAADTYGTTAGSQQSDMLAEQDRGLTDDGDDGDDGGKIVCTAMNNAYGFGSFRQTIWLKHSANMSPEYEAGYHVLFQPLVNYAYKTEKFGYKTLRKTLEHIARRRTADIWKQRHGKRDVIGAVERAVLEPLCYITGYIKMRIK